MLNEPVHIAHNPLMPAVLEDLHLFDKRAHTLQETMSQRETDMGKAGTVGPT